MPFFWEGSKTQLKQKRKRFNTIYQSICHGYSCLQSKKRNFEKAFHQMNLRGKEAKKSVCLYFFVYAPKFVLGHLFSSSLSLSLSLLFSFSFFILSGPTNFQESFLPDLNPISFLSLGSAERNRKRKRREREREIKQRGKRKRERE